MTTLDEQIRDTDTEVRYAPIEFRDSGSELVIEGWPILFNSEGQVFDGMGKRGYFTEIIKPGALDNADFSDCVLVPNHARQNAELPLAATYNGTLKADIKNPKGVKMRATVDPTRHDVQDTVKAIRSGLMPQMSFAWPTNDNGFRDSWDAAHEVRTIHSIGTILDFSVVPRGAYSQTSLKVKQRSAARVMSMFPDETRFVLWCASEQRKGAKISAENKGKLGQVLGHLQAAQVHVGDLLSLNGEDPNSFVTLTGAQQDGAVGGNLTGGSQWNPSGMGDGTGSRSKLTQRERDLLDIYTEVLEDERREDERMRAMVDEIFAEMRALVACPVCHGKGTVTPAAGMKRKCTLCNGSGEVSQNTADEMLLSGDDASVVAPHRSMGAEYEAYTRAKFSDDDRKQLAKQGHALPDGSFPIRPGNITDLNNAVKATPLGNAPDNAIKAYIIKHWKAAGKPTLKTMPTWLTKGA